MRRSSFLFLASTLCGLCACNETAAPPPLTPPPPQTAPHLSAAVNTGADSIELVESVPAETTLDHADVRDAPTVWPEMIDRAKTTIDFAEFYASDAENGGVSGKRSPGTAPSPGASWVNRALTYAALAVSSHCEVGR